MNWIHFFRAAGIPDAASQQYCASFVKNRIQKSDLSDLDKETLSQLGVKAIGDQLAILRHIKSGTQTSSTTPSTVTKPQRVRIEAPDSSSSSDISMASFHRKGRPPPDSQEIYHVKMPQGTTARTRQILLKAKHLQSRGVLRGTTGVRQGGRPVEPIDKTSVAVKNMRREEPGHVRIINNHIAGKNASRVTYGTRTFTVTVPEGQQRSGTTFGGSTETRAISRTVINKPVGKVVSSSRITKRIERPGTSRSLRHRLSFGVRNGRNNRIQLVEDELIGDEEVEEDVIYEEEDTVDPSLYMDDGDEYVEFVEQPRRDVFSRVSM